MRTAQATVRVRLNLRPNGSSQNAPHRTQIVQNTQSRVRKRVVQKSQDRDRAARTEQMADRKNSRPPKIGGIGAKLRRNEPVNDSKQAIAKVV